MLSLSMAWLKYAAKKRLQKNLPTLLL